MPLQGSPAGAEAALLGRLRPGRYGCRPGGSNAGMTRVIWSSLVLPPSVGDKGGARGTWVCVCTCASAPAAGTRRGSKRISWASSDVRSTLRHHLVSSLPGAPSPSLAPSGVRCCPLAALTLDLRCSCAHGDLFCSTRQRTCIQCALGNSHTLGYIYSIRCNF